MQNKMTFTDWVRVLFWTACIGWLSAGSLMFYFTINDRSGFILSFAVMVLVTFKAIYHSDFLSAGKYRFRYTKHYQPIIEAGSDLPRSR